MEIFVNRVDAKITKEDWECLKTRLQAIGYKDLSAASSWTPDLSWISINLSADDNAVDEYGMLLDSDKFSLQPSSDDSDGVIVLENATVDLIVALAAKKSGDNAHPGELWKYVEDDSERSDIDNECYLVRQVFGESSFEIEDKEGHKMKYTHSIRQGVNNWVKCTNEEIMKFYNHQSAPEEVQKKEEPLPKEEKPPFEVGDLVRCINDEILPYYADNWTEKDKIKKGDVLQVERIRKMKNGWEWGLDFEGKMYTHSSRAFTLSQRAFIPEKQEGDEDSWEEKEDFSCLNDL